MAKKKIVRPKYVAKENRKKEPMAKNLKIGLWAGCGLLVLAILLFALLYNDGSLPIRDNQIANKQDNWIISKLQVARGDKYFLLGEVTEPLEGFEINPTMTIKSDTNETSFWYEPTDTECQVESYYISGVSASVAEMAETLPMQFAIYSPQSVMSELKTTIVAAREASYFIVNEPAPETETETAAEETDQETDAEANTQEENPHATQQIICYIPSVRNSCILISVSITVTDDMPEWSEEQLVEFLQDIGSKIAVAQL